MPVMANFIIGIYEADGAAAKIGLSKLPNQVELV